jgi:two-component system OmpR family response regulator
LSVPGVASQKLFVVNDEEAIAELLGRYLREAHLDVETFYDASSALLRATDCPPDILVSDIVMPDFDGIRLAQAVRKEFPNCKVILMSGNPAWKNHGDFHGSGLDDFTLLTKPFRLSQLLRLVKSEAELEAVHCCGAAG